MEKSELSNQPHSQTAAFPAKQRNSKREQQKHTNTQQVEVLSSNRLNIASQLVHV